MAKWALWAAISGVAVVAVAAAVFNANRGPSRPQVGQPAPNFTLPALAGKPVTLDQLRGRPVVVNFWATWCEPCKQEMPALEAATKSHPGLTVLGLDDAEPAEKVRSFVQEYGLTYPILLDGDSAVQQEYRIIGEPTSIFVDSSGIVRAIYLGALTDAELQKDLQAIHA